MAVDSCLLFSLPLPARFCHYFTVSLSVFSSFCNIRLRRPLAVCLPFALSLLFHSPFLIFVSLADVSVLPIATWCHHVTLYLSRSLINTLQVAQVAEWKAMPFFHPTLNLFPLPIPLHPPFFFLLPPPPHTFAPLGPDTASPLVCHVFYNKYLYNYSRCTPHLLSD